MDFYAERKASRLLRVVDRLVGDPSALSFLDVGCGVGVTDGFLVDHVGSLDGVDVAAEAVAEATRANPGVRCAAYDGDTLPFGAARFDVAFAICVVHHVEPADRDGFFAEMARVVRPGGLVVIFEHNPWNPLTRVVVSRCEFDEGVTLAGRSALAGAARRAGLAPVEHRYMTFLPVGGRVGDVSDRALARVPLGAQHYLAARRA